MGGGGEDGKGCSFLEGYLGGVGGSCTLSFLWCFGLGWGDEYAERSGMMSLFVYSCVLLCLSRLVLVRTRVIVYSGNWVVSTICFGTDSFSGEFLIL